jgi:hypothetical protein
VKAEENLDGKCLLRSADPHMTAEDTAAGCKPVPARPSEHGASKLWE